MTKKDFSGGTSIMAFGFAEYIKNYFEINSQQHNGFNNDDRVKFQVQKNVYGQYIITEI